MSNLPLDELHRARVFHIPLKIKAAEIDPLIFYAVANDKGPFSERNERVSSSRTQTND